MPGAHTTAPKAHVQKISAQLVRIIKNGGTLASDANSRHIVAKILHTNLLRRAKRITLFFDKNVMNSLFILKGTNPVIRLDRNCLKSIAG